MTTYETLDLHTRVARYEAAVEELRAAHQDVRSVLQDQVLHARWQQIGAELGFVTAAQPGDGAAPHPGGPPTPAAQHQELHSMNQQIPQMADSWAS
jgi:hypothetical protein